MNSTVPGASPPSPNGAAATGAQQHQSQAQTTSHAATGAAQHAQHSQSDTQYAQHAGEGGSSSVLGSYQDMYEAVKGLPCRVDRIVKAWEVEDDADSPHKPLRTLEHIIDRELDRIYDAETFEQIHEACEETSRNLNKLGVFRDVRVLVYEEPQDRPDLVTVLINVEENNWYKFRAGTFVQPNETSFEVAVGLCNTLGRAEQITISGDIGTERSTQFSADLTQPKPWDLPITVTGRICQLIQNNQKASSYLEDFKGIVLGVRSFDDAHSVDYEFGWRQLTDPYGVASRSVLSQVGDYVKSAIKYTYTLGHKEANVDSGQVKGSAARFGLELSGLGFDPRLRSVKASVDWAAMLPVNDLMSLSFTASAGFILPLGKDFADRETCIADRFFLGRPTLRGFRFKSVGGADKRRPRGAAPSPGEQGAGGDEVDALGGDVFASVNAALLVQPPIASLKNFIQGQVFVNGGNCMQLTGTGRPIAAGLQDFSRTLRWSTGVGLVLPTPMGRFEANYVVVLSHQANDRLKQGFRLGFAASPLI